MFTGALSAIAARRTGPAVEAFVKAGWRDRWLYAVAFLWLAVAYVVAPMTGAKPDIVLALSIVATLLPMVALIVAGVPVLQLRLRKWPETASSQELTEHMRIYWNESGRLHTLVHSLVILIAFSTAFGVFKSSIAMLNPFAWDAAFADADRILHLGFYPHELLMPLFGNAPTLFVINIAYHFWFFLLLTGMLVAGQIVRDAQLRQQFLMAFMLTWGVGGFIVATVFSSAGPCYFERVGLGDTYSGLMAQLQAANDVLPIMSLGVQEYLWNGYVGQSASSGISAFPSMHVSVATLLALGASRLNRTAGYIMWGFAGVIMIGSVVLGWHYAVDGYAGALLTFGFWKLSGLYARYVVPN